jgi:hypothetical protein
MALFSGLLGTEAPQDGAVGGAGRRPPLEPLVRRGCTSGGARGSPGSWSGGPGGGEALNLVGSGLRPRAPRAGRHGGSEDGLARVRRVASQLYRRRAGEGVLASLLQLAWH